MYDFEHKITVFEGYLLGVADLFFCLISVEILCGKGGVWTLGEAGKWPNSAIKRASVKIGKGKSGKKLQKIAKVGRSW